MRLRVATFNMENLDIGPEWPPIEARVPTLQAQLRGLDADILCLQEVNGQRLPGARARQRLWTCCKAHGLRKHPAPVRSASSGGAYVSNLVTLSRFHQRRALLTLVPRCPQNHLQPNTDATEVAGTVLLHTEIAVSEPVHGNLHLRAPIASAVCRVENHRQRPGAIQRPGRKAIISRK
jgi:endonuclease/exonuclease/phosphatase family metal-dependent hydrolase